MGVVETWLRLSGWNHAGQRWNRFAWNARFAGFFMGRNGHA